jgi:hypothetical protein
MIRRSAFALLLCLTLLAACRQILGLKHAHSEAGNAGADGTAGTRGSMPNVSAGVPPEGTSCEKAPSQSCTSCLRQKCGATLDKYLNGRDYRAELDNYAVCLTTECSPDQENCSMSLSDSVLRNCVSDCAVECNVALVSQCTLYCACMTQYCSDPAVLLKDWNCMSTCINDLPSYLIQCRRKHCEFGQGNPMHCMHASDLDHQCFTKKEVDDTNRWAPCPSGSESTWPCDPGHDSQCCSGTCNDGACL